MRSRILVSSSLLLTVVAQSASAGTPSTAYFVGNSLTAGTTGSDAVKNLAAVRGIDLTYGWHIRYGASLKFIHDNPHVATGISGYGYWDAALPNNTWEAVTLETWGDTLADNKTSIAAMVSAARSNPNNQTTRFYIFDDWCQEYQPTDYSVQWMRTYDLAQPNTTQRRIDTWTRSYSDELINQLHSAAFNSPTDIKRIPTGEVFYQLDQLAQNGQLPGVSGIEQWYIDLWHVGSSGNYVGSLTFLATMYAQNPTGLPAPAGMDPLLAAKIQETIWSVVTSDPYTDVPGAGAWVNESNTDIEWTRDENWCDGVAPGSTSDSFFNLNDTNTVNITPNSTARTMQVNSGNVIAALNGNTLALSENLMVKSSGALSISGTGNLNVAGSAYVGCNYTGSSGFGTLTITGGNVVIGNELRVSSTSAASVNLSGGLLSAPLLKIASGGTVNVTGGTLSVTNVQLTGSGILKLSPGGNKTLKLATLSASDTSKLDLTDNRLVITGMPKGALSGSTYSGVTGLVQSGRNGGYWNGRGIMTSAPPPTPLGAYMSIGVAGAGELGRAGELFGDVTLSASDVLVMYTLGGDADLSGSIDVDDYGQIDFNSAISGILPGWFNGDFDYDGVGATIDDYAIIDFVVASQTFANLGDAGSAITSVPEPSAACGVAMLTASLLKRRRR